MEPPTLNLIFKYARCFNGYEEYGGLRDLAKIANQRLNEFYFCERWNGSARELRACLFFEERRWRHFGYAPEGEDLSAIEELYKAIQALIQEGDLAPNDPSSKSEIGLPAIEIDRQPCRLLEWTTEEGLVLTVALDESGHVVRRRCPPSSINPDDPSVLTSLN